MSSFEDFESDDEALFEEEPLEDAPITPEVPQEVHGVQARQKLRDQLARDMEEFLKRGGQIQQIADNVRADPPRKPASDYGSAPI